MAGKPRTEPTPQIVECMEKFDAVVALVEAGATVREAVPRVSNTMAFDTFRKWVKRTPDKNARMKVAQRTRDAGPKAVYRRTTRKKPPPQAAPGRDDIYRHFDAIIGEIEAGTDIQDAVKISGRDYSQFNRWVGRNPRMQERFKLAVARARDASIYSDVNYDRALEEMVAWDGDLQATTHAGISYTGIYQRQSTKLDYKVKYDAAIARRNARLGIVHVRYEEADYLRLVERIKAKPRRGMERIIAEMRAEGLHTPNDNALRAYARRNAAVRYELDEAMQLKRKVVERARRAPPATKLTQYELRRHLLENELFRKSTALLRMSDHQDLDDMRSDAIVAMLEQREVTRGELIRAHHRKVSSRSMWSLDDELAPGFTRMHTLTAQPIHEAA